MQRTNVRNCSRLACTRWTLCHKTRNIANGVEKHGAGDRERIFSTEFIVELTRSWDDPSQRCRSSLARITTRLLRYGALKLESAV